MKNIIYYPVGEPANQLGTEIASRGQCDCDCDCACPSDLSPSVFEPFQATSWRKADDLYSLPLSSEYMIFASAKNNGFAVLDSHARGLLNSFASPFPVHSSSFGSETLNAVRHFAAAGLLSPLESDCACVSSANSCRSTEISNSSLVAWLHLTDRCNLQCSYCYLPHVREDMSSETGRGAIDAIFRSALIHGFKQIKLKYAGGEPLLRFPLIVELHRYAMSLAGLHGLRLDGVVLSNGTLLTARIIENLRSLELRLMISLDGLGQFHDAHRPYIGGRGSFADVAEAINLTLANNLVPNISVTVSSRTVDGLPDIMAWILERDLPFGLNFYRENELSISHEDMKLDERVIINGMFAAFNVIENPLPRRSFLGGIIDRTNLSSAHTHTCGVGQNYLVFDQNGQVAKCQMRIREPITNVHVSDPLAAIRADQIGIQNLSVEEKEGCKTCEWKYWCAGGCPLETYRATGRYDVKSPNCNIYKALFPEALRLEGLRLLKYQDDPEVVVKY